MRTTRQLSVTLPLEMADMVRSKVASGRYATESEVIRDGLRALQTQEAAIERWLIEEVAPAYDAHMADPSRAVALEEVFEGAEARYLARKAARK